MKNKTIQIELADVLRSYNLTIGTAESCTGGTLVSHMTSFPGSSAYVKGGIVAYSNEVKAAVLGVSEEDILQHGAVSETVVQQMVRGAQRVLACDCAVATSGISGPSGGTEEKPVGTVWIAVAYAEKIQTRRCRFIGTRAEHVQETEKEALRMLITLIKEAHNS